MARYITAFYIYDKSTFSAVYPLRTFAKIVKQNCVLNTSTTGIVLATQIIIRVKRQTRAIEKLKETFNVNNNIPYTKSPHKKYTFLFWRRSFASCCLCKTCKISLHLFEGIFSIRHNWKIYDRKKKMWQIQEVKLENIIESSDNKSFRYLLDPTVTRMHQTTFGNFEFHYKNTTQYSLYGCDWTSD